MPVQPRLIIALLAILLIPDISSAQVARLKIQYRKCSQGFSLTNGPGWCNTETAYGTAVAVAHWRGGTVYVTAGHNFRPPEGYGVAQLHSLTIDGRIASVLTQKIEGAIDFGVAFVRGGAATLIPIARTPPKVGDKFIAAGFDFADSSEPQIRYYRSEVIKAEKGSFGDSGISWPRGSSGGSILRISDGALIGLAAHTSSFMINWPRCPENPTDNGFREVVAAVARGATFESSPIIRDIAPPPPDEFIDETVPDPREPESKPESSQERQDDERNRKLKELAKEVERLKAAAALASKSQSEDSGNSDEGQAGEIDHSSGSGLLDSGKKIIGGAIDSAAGNEGSGSLIADGAGVAAGVAGTAFGGPVVGAIASAAVTSLAYGGVEWFRRRRRKRREGEAAEVEERNVRDRIERDQSLRTEIENSEATSKDLQREKESLERQLKERNDAIEKEKAAQVEAKEAEGADSRLAPPVVNSSLEVREDSRLESIIQYLRDKEVSSARIEEAIEGLSGITAKLQVQPDGSVAENYYKDGVELAAAGSPLINVLGGPQVGRSIIDYVAKRTFEAVGGAEPGGKS